MTPLTNKLFRDLMPFIGIETGIALAHEAFVKETKEADLKRFVCDSNGTVRLETEGKKQ